jgi:uncharacterized membrane protein
VPFITSFLLGAVAGLRSMTAPAALAGAARLSWIPVATTPFGVLAGTPAAVVLSLLAAGRSVAAGAIVGAAGAATGALVGFRVRRSLVKDRRWPDLVVALAEDVVGMGGALRLVSHA